MWVILAFLGSVVLQGIVVRLLPLPNKVQLVASAVLFFIQIAVIAGLRGRHVFNDTDGYVSHFEGLQLGPGEQWYSLDPGERFESGYQFLERLIRFNVSENPRALLVTTSVAIQGSVVWYLLRTTRIVWLGYYVYCASGCAVFMISGIRQALAIAMALPIVLLLERRRWFWTFCIVGVAVLFHSSAWILLVLICVGTIRLTRRNFVTVGLLSLLAAAAVSAAMEEVMLAYFGDSDYIGLLESDKVWGALYRAAFLVAQLGIAVLCGGLRASENDRVTGILMWSLVIAIVLSLVSPVFMIVARFGYYFRMMSVPLCARLIAELPAGQRRGYTMLVVIVFLTDMLIVLSVRPEWYSIVPFELATW